MRFSGWASSGWAFHCTGDHPFFWGLQQGNVDAFTWDDSCFSVAEDEFVDEYNKLDVTMMNWCWYHEEVTVTLACSATRPPDLASCPTNGSPVQGDPGCKQSNIKSHCNSTGGAPQCGITYTETCTNGLSYDCTTIDGLSWCQQCRN